MTSATIALRYRLLINDYANRTSDEGWFCDWQGHDFSFRGMSSFESAIISGSAHLTSFTGTDNVGAIPFLEDFYGADRKKELIGGSVPATEHSVMCMGKEEAEEKTFIRLLTEVYPKGILSVVSDTWDYWKVITEILPNIKDIIMKRDGKLVIRPDSGDPIKIICGDEDAGAYSPAYKGSVELLWEIFGGKINSKGYKQLDSHIGLIYGDSITYERAEEIFKQLEVKGFASTNVVFGIGSYTYQYVTRDTFGFAIKSTYGVVDGISYEISKNPKTDSGIKKSAKGLLKVEKIDGKLICKECVTQEEEKTGLLETVFKDGEIVKEHTLSEIRERLKEQWKK